MCSLFLPFHGRESEEGEERGLSEGSRAEVRLHHIEMKAYVTDARATTCERHTTLQWR